MGQLGFEFSVQIYLLIGILIIFGLWVFYDQRDKHLYEAERIRVIFHCLKCGQLFTEKKETEVARCTRCGYENSRIRF